MEIKRPLLLISNDDGYQAKGINCLIDMLKDIADILVCAPDGPAADTLVPSRPAYLCDWICSARKMG